jgi:hypothetical protein
MAKTFKDKANYYKHHTKHDNPYSIKKDKHKIDPEDIPAAIKPMIDKLEYGYSGARHGNNRKMYSDMKVTERRTQRAKDKNEFRKELQAA